MRDQWAIVERMTPDGEPFWALLKRVRRADGSVGVEVEIGVSWDWRSLKVLLPHGAKPVGVVKANHPSVWE